jgi:uncharacterized protein
LPNSVVLVNSLSGAIDEVTLECYRDLVEERLDPEMESYLSLRGHLTQLNEDEEKDLALELWAELDKSARARAAVVICPSMDCNFRCTYCFERPLQSRIDAGFLEPGKVNMNVGQVKKIFQAFPALVERHTSIRNTITLFGGEPLWARNYAVVAEIVQQARSLGHTVSAITNGFELSRFCELLGPNGIGFIQVSLDGPASIHDQLRPTVAGGGTFDKILRELESVVDIQGLQVQIRMNYDSRNLEKTPELLQLLSDRGIIGRSNVAFHANLISMNHAHESKDYKTLKLLPILSGQLQDIELDCYTSGLRRDFVSALTGQSPLKHKAHFCAATSGMYVFCPDRQIYACWEGIGEENSRLGSYDPTLNFDEAGMSRWHRRNALAMPACQTCSHLFMCGGGCAIHALERTGEINTSECDGLRKKYEIMVKNVMEKEGSFPTTQLPIVA